MSEVSVVKSRASVMLYNNEKKAWEPAEGIRGMSYIQVYQHEGNQTYRIVGRSMTDQQVVVINCAIVRNMKYNAATPTFHQWRDQRQVFGLNFHSKDDAAQFKEAIDAALDDLNTAAQKPAAPATQQYVPPTNQSWQSRYVSQSNDSVADEPERTQEPEKPKTVSTSVSLTPAVPVAPVAPSIPQPPAAPPTPPAAPAAPAVPAAPPAPPGGPGGVPAPPPPPPPPPAGGAGGGGGLAAQIAAAKLNKSKSNTDAAVKPRGGDMMAEMQRKLAARKAKDGEETTAPRGQADARPVPTVNKTPAKVNHVPAAPSMNPTPIKSTTSIKQDRAQHNDSSISSNQLQELKAEILSAFRRELDAAKTEIIQAMKQELSRI